MEKDIHELIEPSRRDVLKQGALASSALALGLGSGTVAGASSAAQQQQPSQTLMYTNDYEPGRTLEVVAPLQQSVTRQVLGQETGDDGGDGQIIDDTSEWSTILSRYTVEGEGQGEYIIVFTREGELQQGDEFQPSSPVSFFNEEFGLLEVTLGDGGGGDGGTTGNGGTTTDDTDTDDTATDDTSGTNTTSNGDGG